MNPPSSLSMQGAPSSSCYQSQKACFNLSRKFSAWRLVLSTLAWKSQCFFLFQLLCPTSCHTVSPAVRLLRTEEHSLMSGLCPLSLAPQAERLPHLGITDLQLYLHSCLGLFKTNQYSSLRGGLPMAPGRTRISPELQVTLYHTSQGKFAVQRIWWSLMT